MKKIWRRVLALAAVLALMTTGVGAAQYWIEAESLGQQIQPIVDYEHGLSSLCVVEVLPVGSVIQFSQEVRVSHYGENADREYTPKVIGMASSLALEDSATIYVVETEAGGMAMFRGAQSQLPPVTMVGDHSDLRSYSLKLSKPVIRVSVRS